MFDKEKTQIEKQILAYCAENELPEPEDIQWSRIPFSGEWGLATSFFQLAAEEARSGKKINVPERAQQIAEAISKEIGTPSGFSRVEAVKGYLNFYFSTAEFSRRVMDTVLQEAGDYGRGPASGRRVMVEFSQPNTHKAIHVGHLRNMIFGDTICNILEFSGDEIVRANYIGDVGLHVIQWLWNYQNYHAGEKPSADVTRWMGDLYAEAVQRLEDNPELEPRVRELFARWDHRDPQVIDLWKETRRWSLDGFNEIYELMNIKFDHFYYESDVEESGKDFVNRLIDKGIATDERPDGPVIVKIDELLGLEKEQYRTFVVLRSDDTSLYATKDLSLGLKKFEDFYLDLSLYIVDVRQSLHFQQVFKTLELAGYEQIKKAKHIPYEIVNLPGNVTMSSREGTVVLLEDLIREATRRAKEVVQEKNPSLSAARQNEVAEAVALGAIKYPMLARDNTRIATFDWETALDFNGQAAPYIQYAHVRANSILRRMEAPLPENVEVGHALEPPEIELIELIARVPDEIQRAAAEYKTLYITTLAYQLAKAFNEFYNQCPVLQAEPPVRAARLRLVAAAKQAIANCLNLLGITAPDFM